MEEEHSFLVLPCPLLVLFCFACLLAWLVGCLYTMVVGSMWGHVVVAAAAAAAAAVVVVNRTRMVHLWL